MKAKKVDLRRLLMEMRLLLILFALMGVLSLLSDRFLTIGNLTNVLWSVCLIGIMSAGFIYAPITGGIDLSVGSMAALSGIIANALMNVIGVPWPLALLLTMAIGLGIGFLNGIVTTKFRVPPFIVTMAALTYLFGFAMLISGGDERSITEPAGFLLIGTGKLFGTPLPIYIMLLTIVGSHILLKHTAFGRRAIAVGANETAAKLSGVDPDKTRIIAYTLSSGTATLAGIVMASLTQQAYAMNARGYELDVITAVVVGGTSLMGGSGSVVGALIGAVMVGFINNGLNLMNMPASFHPLATGIVILAALILNQGIHLPRGSIIGNKTPKKA